jgi:hypothetical protein
MMGHVTSRHNLGINDANAGNVDQAIKHWLIAASFGDIRAVNDIKKLLIMGYAMGDHYAQALKKYQEYLDESKVIRGTKLPHTVLVTSI